MREAIPPLPQYAFMAWCLAKHRDNLLDGGNILYVAKKTEFHIFQADAHFNTTLPNLRDERIT
jgi:hypothetical protein